MALPRKDEVLWELHEGLKQKPLKPLDEINMEARVKACTLAKLEVAHLRDAFSESNLPILVDVLDWAQIPDSFRQEIIRCGTVRVYVRD